MRTKSLIFGLGFLLALPLLLQANWPAGLKDLSDSTIHTAAMEKVKEFSEKFSSDPSAGEAAKLLKSDSASKDKNAWLEDTLLFVSQVLKTHPPDDKNREIREAALLILDYPIHVDANSKGADPKLATAWKDAISNYYKARTEQAVKDILAEKPGKGLTVWKMYNMGFVVKSKSRTIGFDIIPDMGRALDTKQIAALAKKLDILFISHAHGDHMSFELIKTMLKSGKKVVMPASIAKMIRMEDKNIIQLYDNYKESTDIGGVKVLSFPGKQDQLDCAVYVVTLDGCTVSHNGDNGRGDIYQEIAKGPKIDVLLANCWAGMRGYIEAAKPELVISGHENELGHEVSHRESYLRTFRNLDGLKGPKVFVVECGERIAYSESVPEKSKTEPAK